MSVVKTKTGWATYVYDPAIKRKRYVGTRKLEREAKALFREKTSEFKGEKPGTTTVQAFSADWLEHYHGPGTKRPEHSTYEHNRVLLKPFVEAFGPRLMDGGIRRQEALTWSRSHYHHSRVVCAMFNDALDAEVAKGNPFANRRMKMSRERKDIAPITEQELETLANIALRQFGEDGYGVVARAWILFAAWVGCRPGETFSVELRNLYLAEGLVKVRRVKKRGGEYPTDTIVLPDAAADAVRDARPYLADKGPMFRTVSGKEFSRDALRRYWGLIRSGFRQTVTDERWAELTRGDAKWDFYVLRHYAASMIVERGGNEFDVSAQLGNSPQTARATYIHSYRDQANERNRRLLNQPTVVDELRERRGA